MDCTIHKAKTKALISFAVTAKLICVFVFAYAKSRFSHDEAQMTEDYDSVTPKSDQIFMSSNIKVYRLRLRQIDRVLSVFNNFTV